MTKPGRVPKAYRKQYMFVDDPPTVKSVAKKERKLAKQVNTLRRHVNIQSKYKDQIATGIISSTFGYLDLTAIAGGTGDSQRSSSNIKLNSVQLDFLITGNAASTFTSNINRFIVFQWNDNTLPQDVDILDNTQIAPGVQGFYSQNNKHRYRILYDKMVELGNQALSQIPFEKHWKVYIKLKNECDYASTALTSGKGGRIFLMYLNDDSTFLDDQNITVVSRLRFSD